LKKGLEELQRKGAYQRLFKGRVLLINRDAFHFLAHTFPFIQFPYSSPLRLKLGIIIPFGSTYGFNIHFAAEIPSPFKVLTQG